ncbi:MAG: DUF4832 domain-containing protein [Fimbriimonas sp.]
MISALLATSQAIYPEPAPGPLNNPLKGWCPYTIAGPIHQQYSMVFLYVPWSELEPEEGVYRADEWERRTWSTPLAAGKHIVFRVVVDYPGRPSGVPKWLTDKGIKLNPYSDYGGGVSPDYNDPKTVAALEKLVVALGRRYDRNPRVAFVQFGLLGFWGEWHTYPRKELFASEITQERILRAAQRSFPNKIVLTRYPAGFAGRQPWLGYFDDSFPDDTDGPEDWKFLPKMRTSGRTLNWKRSAIGGEMLPRQASKWLGSEYAVTMKRLIDGHFSWVGPYCPAKEEKSSTEFLERSAELVRKMGYQFRLTKVVAPANIKRRATTVVELEGENQGVAPFYYRWPVRLALLNSKERVITSDLIDVDVRKWLPGPFTSRVSATFDAPAGEYRLGLGVIDPWTRGPAIRFANKLPVVNGWMILKAIKVTR